MSKGKKLLENSVTPERAEEVTQLLGQAMAAGWGEGLQTWLQTAETDAPTIRHDGKTYRYKLDSEKEFLTPAGIIRV